MRGPFSVTPRCYPELAGFGAFRTRPELSELGWFNEGLAQLLTERCCRKRQLLTGIHKETPMFSGLFQEKQSVTLGILKGFQPESAEIHGKQQLSAKDKIALQGAGFHQKGDREVTINNTVFLVSRIIRLWPLYAAESLNPVQ